jgi:nucleoside-diphosphate-sugar epimerase
MESIPEKSTAAAMHNDDASVSGASVLVIGGTGFIGYHIVQQLLAQGLAVSLLTRNPERTRNLFPASVQYRQGDLETLTVEQLAALMQGCEKLVFAAGIDERTEPRGDAWDFFKHANVDSVEKVFRAAQQSAITHAVLLSSIFLNVHREHPELLLAERHPYIRSRVEQHRVSKALAENYFVLTTLEIPWVFGTAPHVQSQWNSLITYVRSATPLMCCRGGVNVVAVQSVAEATVSALNHTTTSSTQAIGDLNLSYQQLVEMLCHYAGRRDQQVRMVNEEVFQKLMQAGGLFRKLFNVPAGLDIRYLPELLMRDIYIDKPGGNRELRHLLNHTTGLAEQAIRETVQAAPESRYVKGWRTLLNLFQPKRGLS